MTTPRWVSAAPKWWHLIVAIAALTVAVLSAARLPLRVGAVEAYDRVQDSMAVVRIDGLRRERNLLRDSLIMAIGTITANQRTMQDNQEAMLRLQCVQTPDLYQRLAKVSCK